MYEFCIFCSISHVSIYIWIFIPHLYSHTVPRRNFIRIFYMGKQEQWCKVFDCSHMICRFNRVNKCADQCRKMYRPLHSATSRRRCRCSSESSNALRHFCDLYLQCNSSSSSSSNQIHTITTSINSAPTD